MTTSTNKWLAAAAIAVAWSALTTPAWSQGYTQEEQQACQPDAFRLCGDAIPDVNRVTACMVARQAELSPQCRRFFRAPAPVATAPTDIKPKTMRKKLRKPAKSSDE